MLFLDCSIRDGGYLNNWDFSLAFAKRLCCVLDEVGFDYMEIGFWNPAKADQLWRHCPVSVIREMFTEDLKIKPALLIDFGSVELEDIPSALQSYDCLLRIAAHKGKILEACSFAEELKDRGFAVSVNAMGITGYSSSDLMLLCDIASTSIDFLYMADSFGGLLPRETRRIFEILKPSSKATLGFHPHDNLKLSLANSFEAFAAGAGIVDSSLLGLGRGGGNLRSELIASISKNGFGRELNPLPILSFADAMIDQLCVGIEIENDLHQIVSGLARCHPNISSYFMETKRLSIDEVFDRIMNIPSSERHRYDTVEIDNMFDQQRNCDGTVNFKNPLATRRSKKAILICPPASNRLPTILQDDSQLSQAFTVNCVAGDNGIDGMIFGSLRRLWQYGDSSHAVPKYAVTSKPLCKSSPNAEFIDLNELRKTFGIYLNSSGAIATALLINAGFDEISVHGADGFAANRGYNDLPESIALRLDRESEDERNQLHNWIALNKPNCKLRWL